MGMYSQVMSSEHARLLHHRVQSSQLYRETCNRDVETHPGYAETSPASQHDAAL